MFESLKVLLSNELKFVEKFSNDIDLTQAEIELIKAAYNDCAVIMEAINEELPRNIWGRKYSLNEAGEYVRDDNGTFISVRGIGGAVWYRKIGEKSTYPGNKFIGPFGG